MKSYDHIKRVLDTILYTIFVFLRYSAIPQTNIHKQSKTPICYPKNVQRRGQWSRTLGSMEPHPASIAREKLMESVIDLQLLNACWEDF